MRKWAEEVANGTEIDEQRWNITGFVRGEEAKNDVPVPGLGICVNQGGIHRDRGPEGEAKFGREDEFIFVHTVLMRFL